MIRRNFLTVLGAMAVVPLTGVAKASDAPPAHTCGLERVVGGFRFDRGAYKGMKPREALVKSFILDSSWCYTKGAQGCPACHKIACAAIDTLVENPGKGLPLSGRLTHA